LNASQPQPTYESLQEYLATFGQQHLLDGWEQLAPSSQQHLAEQIVAIDFALLEQLAKTDSDVRGSQVDWDKLAAKVRPAKAFCSNDDAKPLLANEAEQAGRDALRDERVGVIVVAGGQGSRLGFPHAKGLYPLGPLSNRSLFQIQIEKLLATRRQFDAPIPLYVMTSPATHDETVAYLHEKNRFGLPAEDVKFFCQGTMPAVDAKTGQVLLASPNSLALSPDGHGGMLAAFEQSDCLADAKGRGIDQLFYFQIDNPLVRVVDVELIGYHLMAKSEMTCQVVPRRTGEERLGVVVEIEGRTSIIEYIDMEKLGEVGRRRESNGRCYLWPGSIAVHVMDLAFLQKMAKQKDALPYHQAKKKVSYFDPRRGEVTPGKNDAENAIKFERFIFDLIPHATNPIVVEADEAEVFAPVKNESGQPTETAETARAAMIAQHTRWLQAAGATIEEGVTVEINPLFANRAKELAKKIEPGLHVTEATYFE